MLSAFHKKKMRTLIFSKINAHKMKILSAFQKMKMWKTLLAKDGTDNIKVLSAFHRKKMQTTFWFEKWCRQVFTLIHLYFKKLSSAQNEKIYTHKQSSTDWTFFGNLYKCFQNGQNLALLILATFSTFWGNIIQRVDLTLIQIL